jgi:TusA-related sulfurtransferase
VKVSPNRKLNFIGLFCPEPVVKTREELDKMKANETFERLPAVLLVSLLCQNE